MVNTAPSLALSYSKIFDLFVNLKNQAISEHCIKNATTPKNALTHSSNILCAASIRKILLAANK